jgi:ferrous iron transport protein A
MASPLDAVARPPHMHRELFLVGLVDMTDSAAPTANSTPLGEANRGFCGRISAIHVNQDVHGRQAHEIESRLIELGFVEGAEIKILHEGPIGRDPIAVRINGTTIALRRREAMAIFVTPSNRNP